LQLCREGILSAFQLDDGLFRPCRRESPRGAPTSSASAWTASAMRSFCLPVQGSAYTIGVPMTAGAAPPSAPSSVARRLLDQKFVSFHHPTVGDLLDAREAFLGAAPPMRHAFTSMQNERSGWHAHHILRERHQDLEIQKRPR